MSVNEFYFELKPCPFCGKIPALHNSHFKYYIKHTCGIITVNIGLCKKQDAINNWNRRYEHLE